MKREQILYVIATLTICCVILMLGLYIGKSLVKPKEIIQEAVFKEGFWIQQDTELLNNYINLQTEYDKLLAEYTTFSHHLETYERGCYDGYLKAKGIEAEE